MFPSNAIFFLITVHLISISQSLSIPPSIVPSEVGEDIVKTDSVLSNQPTVTIPLSHPTSTSLPAESRVRASSDNVLLHETPLPDHVLSNHPSRPDPVLPNRHSSTPKTVLLFHGVTEDYKRLDVLVNRIKSDFPGTMVHSIKLFPRFQSILPLKLQSEELRKYIDRMNITTKITLIGHSQGALIMRHMIQNWDNHNISTFISLVGPHVGVIKIPMADQFYPWLTNSTIADICYNAYGQGLSFCNMWNDPQRQVIYKEQNTFLPSSLCQRPAQMGQKSCTEQAGNLNRLKKLVLVATPDDDTVYPFESALFGYYSKTWGIVPRDQQEFYTSLGLENQEKNGRLVQYLKPGVTHQGMVLDEDVYKKCIKPHIT